MAAAWSRLATWVSRWVLAVDNAASVARNAKSGVDVAHGSDVPQAASVNAANRTTKVKSGNHRRAGILIVASPKDPGEH